MDVLAYSPSVEAYISSMRNGSEKLLDVTEDIVSASVSRKQDAASTFSLTLQNKGGKYNGAFMPFDKIVIYATKLERHKLFSGYVTSFDAFKLYQSDMSISGVCTLYQLQQLYWDPGLLDSQLLMLNRKAFFGSKDRFDTGMAEMVKRLLITVAHYPESKILIQDRIPDEVIDWAKELYEAKVTDVSQSEEMLGQFYDMLAANGMAMMTVSSTSATSAVGAASSKDLTGVSVRNIDDLGPELAGAIKKLSRARQVIISTAIAQLGKPYVWGAEGPDSFDCSGLTQYCYNAAGISIPRTSGDQGGCGPTYSVEAAIPGDILWMSGHVGLAIGGGSYIHAPTTGDVVKISTYQMWSHSVRVVD